MFSLGVLLAALPLDLLFDKKCNNVYNLKPPGVFVKNFAHLFAFLRERGRRFSFRVTHLGRVDSICMWAKQEEVAAIMLRDDVIQGGKMWGK